MQGIPCFEISEMMYLEFTRAYPATISKHPS
jgi:hypothetical protein